MINSVFFSINFTDFSYLTIFEKMICMKKCCFLIKYASFELLDHHHELNQKKLILNGFFMLKIDSPFFSCILSSFWTFAEFWFVLYIQYMYCMYSTFTVCTVHVLYVQYMYCMYSTCAVCTVHVLYVQYMYCMYSTCFVDEMYFQRRFLRKNDFEKMTLFFWKYTFFDTKYGFCSKNYFSSIWTTTMSLIRKNWY